MKSIYTYGGKPASRNLTLADLQAAKGKQKFSQTCVDSQEEAAAAVAAGIDILSVTCPHTASIREAAPETFCHSAVMLTDYTTEESVINAAFEAMTDGADMIYTIRSLKTITTLAEMNIPVMGHLGLVPRHSTWTGGLRAVGKNADEAFSLFLQFRRLEDAGAVAVEVEVVPEEVLAEISPRTGLITSSIGAGSAGDIQFLFMSDICGEGEAPPRHARAYGDLRRLREQIRRERVACLRAFHDDVKSGGFPGREEVVRMPAGELDIFREKLARFEQQER